MYYCVWVSLSQDTIEQVQLRYKNSFSSQDLVLIIVTALEDTESHCNHGGILSTGYRAALSGHCGYQWGHERKSAPVRALAVARAGMMQADSELEGPEASTGAIISACSSQVRFHSLNDVISCVAGLSLCFWRFCLDIFLSNLYDFIFPWFCHFRMDWVDLFSGTMEQR